MPGLDLSAFCVAGLDDESLTATEPVTVTCGRCGEESPWFTYRDDGGADRTAPLAGLVSWALAHECSTPEAS